MMRSTFLTLILLVLAVSAQAGEVDRLYVIDCGWAHATDQSRWSPGVNADVPIGSNWENRRIPGFNFDRAQSSASMEKVARILDENHAQFWINHDKPSSDARRHSPEFYE